MQMVAALDRFRHVADETFQRTSSSEHADEHVARIDLRQPTRWQLKHVVGGTISQGAYHDHVAGAWRRAGARDGSGLADSERGSG